jgi:hypothetical protein
MDNQLNYRQARQIRNRSVSDLIADELIRGKGVGGAIGGAISLRTKARMKGIKEKFDLLNMVRAVTGKSRLATSIIGRLFGRSREDIEYFAGRASPIGERRKKITGLSGQGDGEDTSGMKVVLNQILTFLQKSHEKDMVLREKENNLRESANLDDEKRHRDLIKALSNVGFGGTGETATKEKEGGLLDGIMSIINGLKQQLQSIIEDFKNVKNFLTGINWLSKLSWLRFAVNPYALAAMLVAAGIFAIYNNNKEIREAAAEGDVEKLKGYFANSTGTDADMAGVDSGYNKASIRAALEASGAKGSVKAQAALDNFDKLTTETAPVKSEKVLVNEYLAQKGFYDAGNGNYKSLLDSSKKPTQADFDAASAYAKSKMSTPVPEVSPSPAPAPVPPPAVSEAPKSSAVNTATDTNVSLNLSNTTSAERNQAAQNRTNVINTKAATGQKVPMPLVRNKEDTFQRMIFNSLRLV